MDVCTPVVPLTFQHGSGTTVDELGKGVVGSSFASTCLGPVDAQVLALYEELERLQHSHEVAESDCREGLLYRVRLVSEAATHNAEIEALEMHRDSAERDLANECAVTQELRAQVASQIRSSSRNMNVMVNQLAESEAAIASHMLASANEMTDVLDRLSKSEDFTATWEDEYFFLRRDHEQATGAAALHGELLLTFESAEDTIFNAEQETKYQVMEAHELIQQMQAAEMNALRSEGEAIVQTSEQAAAAEHSFMDESAMVRLLRAEAMCDMIARSALGNVVGMEHGYFEKASDAEMVEVENQLTSAAERALDVERQEFATLCVDLACDMLVDEEVKAQEAARDAQGNGQAEAQGMLRDEEASPWLQSPSCTETVTRTLPANLRRRSSPGVVSSFLRSSRKPSLPRTRHSLSPHASYFLPPCHFLDEDGNSAADMGYGSDLELDGASDSSLAFDSRGKGEESLLLQLTPRTPVVKMVLPRIFI